MLNINQIFKKMNNLLNIVIGSYIGFILFYSVCTDKPLAELNFFDKDWWGFMLFYMFWIKSSIKEAYE
jgi:hypothetical protein